jgi:Rrf2 family cysteine metabolism transcriptional repressor
MVSQKCQYAVRAMFELSRLYGRGPVRISEIADAQAIPPRFLEVILSQLKRAGFVRSRRGPEGGYLLARSPDQIKVGEIVQFMEGPLAPVACLTDKQTEACLLQGRCVFIDMWKRAAEAMSDVYDQTTFQHLVDDEIRLQKEAPLTYSI